MAEKVLGRNKLANTKAPALPLSPVQYDRQALDTVHNILRQYFLTLDNVTGGLLESQGGRYLDTPHSSFISTTLQPAAVINTAYPITLSAVDGVSSNGVYVGSNTANVFPSSRIYAVHTGVYNLQFSLQLENTDSQIQDVNIWLRKNGVNEANSNTKLSVSNKHGAVNGNAVAAWNFFLEYTATTEYYELCWSASSTLVSIPSYAIAAPAPATPSVILTMQFVSRL